METDVLLLADVMEGFRTWSLAQYGLDPAHFNTSPGLSWTACLCLTKQKLEIPTDPKMHLFFDRGLTGGASHTATPFAKANIEKFGHYDKKLMKAYIMVFDCNNQYGGAMMEYLPTGGFEWITLDTTSPEYWTNFVNNQEDEQDKGYFFEVDLEYPQELHDKHDAYPLAPEHVTIKESMLSDHQRKLAKDLDVKIGGKKLCLTLQDKEGYICHYRNLKLYLKHGLKITKVRDVLKFDQSPWVRSYIELNTKLRREAGNTFEKNFAKLMNNSFFGKFYTYFTFVSLLFHILGKTCEDVRKYRDFKIVLNEDRARKLIARPTMRRAQIYEDDLVTVELKRAIVTMDKPR